MIQIAVLLLNRENASLIVAERPKRGLSFLEACEGNWVENGSLRTHVAWHRTLYHVQLGEYEEALTQFDDVIMPWVREGGVKNAFITPPTTNSTGRSTPGLK